MPKIGPIKRNDLVKFLRKANFDGPYSGGKHQFMIRGNVRLTIPNPHKSDISVALLIKILKQAQISKEEWEEL